MLKQVEQELIRRSWSPSGPQSEADSDTLIGRRQLLESFIRRVKAEENIKVPLVPTPKLPEALEMVQLWTLRKDHQKAGRSLSLVEDSF
jgi:hypothetical protein